MTDNGTIPAELLNKDSWDDFLKWLIEIPIDLYTTRRQARRWASMVGTTIQRDRWEQLENAWIKHRAV